MHIKGIVDLGTHPDGLRVQVCFADGKTQWMPCTFATLQDWIAKASRAKVIEKLRDYPMEITIEDGVIVKVARIATPNTTQGPAQKQSSGPSIEGGPLLRKGSGKETGTQGEQRQCRRERRYLKAKPVPGPVMFCPSCRTTVSTRMTWGGPTGNRIYRCKECGRPIHSN